MLSIKQERPVLICEVEVLSEEDDTTTTVSPSHACGLASAGAYSGSRCSRSQTRSLHARHPAFAWCDKLLALLCFRLLPASLEAVRQAIYIDVPRCPAGSRT